MGAAFSWGSRSRRMEDSEARNASIMGFGYRACGTECALHTSAYKASGPPLRRFAVP
ncbi:unnamed protein product [Mycena citricolor]|uniref:Uncharacterized protein n=1 Tax=Mycena citricolor TaxID=2018698 RepID=A0AAD2K441_9AGAR|nr:unnamed protein product [Mycena citricolor]CAK5277870.1 unnamed protein product [Mycena citricolor]